MLRKLRVDYTLGTTRDATRRSFAKAPRDSSLVEACVELNLGLALALALALTPSPSPQLTHPSCLKHIIL